MSTSYTPRPGSVPARVIEHLQKNGGTLNAQQIERLCKTTANNVTILLKLATQHGLLHRTRAITAGRVYQWSLPDDAVAGTLAVVARGGTANRAAADPSDQLVITAWPDGEITLKGFTPNEDDGITLSPSQIARIAMHRPGARAV